MARLQDFDAYLRQNSIPISGLQNNGPAPAGIVIQFLPAATQQQKDWAIAARDAFDWRERRLLTMPQIFAGINGLTAGQQNTIMRYMIAQFMREHKDECNAALGITGITLPIDEVDPTVP